MKNKYNTLQDLYFRGIRLSGEKNNTRSINGIRYIINRIKQEDEIYTISKLLRNITELKMEVITK